MGIEGAGVFKCSGFFLLPHFRKRSRKNQGASGPGGGRSNGNGG